MSDWDADEDVTGEPRSGGAAGETSSGEADDRVTILFEEVQQPPWPLMALGLGGTAGGAIAVARALSMFARFGVAALAMGGVGMVASEFLVPMKTTLLTDELQIKFGRRSRFRIPLRNVRQAYARTYDAVSEYGGWGGIRGADGNRAFNMRGNLGVQLVLRSGQKVLIGSDQPDVLAAAIRDVTGCDGIL